MANTQNVRKSLDLTIIIPIGGKNPGTSTLESWFTGELIREINFVFVFDALEPAKATVFERIINLQKATNVKILHVSCNNPGGARNFGLREVETVWVGFFDSDDLPDLKNISAVLNSDNFQNSDIIRGSYGTCSKKYAINPKIIKEDFDSSNYWDFISFGPGIWRYLFKTELIKDKKFPELSLAEDQIFLMQVFWSAPSIKKSNLNFYTYFLGNSNQLTSNRSKLVDLVQVFNLGRISIFDANNEIQKNLASIVMARALVSSRSNFNVFSRILFQLFTKVDFSNIIRTLMFVKMHLSLRARINSEE